MDSRRARGLLLPSAVVVVALLSPGPLAGAVPTPKPVEASADVTLVEVPVHAIGPDGYPLRGLTKADFELFDDGKRVEIDTLEVIDLEDFSRPLASPEEMPLPAAARRHFFLLFDLTFSQPVNLARARSAARDFVLNGMKNGDVGAVATFDVERGMKLVLSFTPDRDQLAAAVETLGLPSLLSPAADPLALTIYNPVTTQGSGGLQVPANRGSAQAIGDAEMADALATQSKLSEKLFDTYQQGRIRQFSRAMGDLARTLASVRGRKNVVYFSEGFDSKLLSGVMGPESGRADGDKIVSGELWRVESEDRYGRSEVKLHLQEMFQLFRRSDAVIQAVDVSGIRPSGSGVEASFSGDTGPAERLGSRGRGEDTLFFIADSTGGQLLKNSNEVGEHLEKLQQQTALVYLLVFSPRGLKEPGKYRPLKVKVNRSGVKVSARAGYYEPRPWSKLTAMEKRLAAAEQIAYGLPRTDIPIRALAAPLPRPEGPGALVPVILEISGKGLLRDGPPDKANVEIYAYAVDKGLRVKDLVTQSLSVDLPKLRGKLESSGVKFYGDLFLPPGTFWLKVLVRNADTGRTGLAIVPVSVPLAERKDLYVLPPLFHDAPGAWVMVKAAARPTAPAPGPYPFVSGGDSFIPAAGPVVAAGAEAPLTLMAWNVPEGADLEPSAEVRDHLGKLAGRASLSVTSREAPGKGPRGLLCALRPEGLPPGGYSLIVTLRDRRSGAEAQSAGTFEVR